MSAPLVFDPPARAELLRALAALELAEATHRPLPMCQALLRVARCYRALGALAPAEAALQQALRWAHAGAGSDLTVDVLCESAETAAARARHLAAPYGAAALSDLADPPASEESSAARRAARERARDHAFEAAARAGAVSDPVWEVQVLLRASEVLEQCGDHDDAEQLKLRAFGRCTGSLGPRADVARLPGTGRSADA